LWLISFPISSRLSFVPFTTTPQCLYPIEGEDVNEAVRRTGAAAAAAQHAEDVAVRPAQKAADVPQTPGEPEKPALLADSTRPVHTEHAASKEKEPATERRDSGDDTKAAHQAPQVMMSQQLSETPETDW
jgi:hypothetical protein